MIFFAAQGAGWSANKFVAILAFELIVLAIKHYTKLARGGSNVADQSAAKQQYDALVKELEPKLGQVSQCRSASLVPLQQEIADIKGRLESALCMSDYVSALQCAGELAPKVNECLAKKQEAERQRKEYEDLLGALQPRLSEASYARYAKLAPIQDEMRAVQWQMESAAQSDDFEQALTCIKDLATEIDAYFTAKKELEAKRRTYEEARGTVDKRLAELSAGNFKKLATMQNDIVAALTQIEAAVQNDDYDLATDQIGGLSSKVDDYVSVKSELDSNKSQYDELKSELESRLDETPRPVYSKLEPMYEELRSLQSQMESAAQSEEYGDAVMNARILSSQIDLYTATKDDLDAKKEEYEEIHGALEFRLYEATQLAESPSPLQEDIVQLQSQMESAVASDEYGEALTIAKDLSDKVDEYFAAKEQAEAQEESSDDALAESEPVIDELVQSDESESTDAHDELAAEDASSERV